MPNLPVTVRSQDKKPDDNKLYLEYGTRYMSARPTLGPAFHEVDPKFKSELKQALKGKD